MPASFGVLIWYLWVSFSAYMGIVNQHSKGVYLIWALASDRIVYYNKRRYCFFVTVTTWHCIVLDGFYCCYILDGVFDIISCICRCLLFYIYIYNQKLRVVIPIHNWLGSPRSIDLGFLLKLTVEQSYLGYLVLAIYII